MDSHFHGNDRRRGGNNHREERLCIHKLGLFRSTIQLLRIYTFFTTFYVNFEGSTVS